MRTKDDADTDENEPVYNGDNIDEEEEEEEEEKEM